MHIQKDYFTNIHKKENFSQKNDNNKKINKISWFFDEAGNQNLQVTCILNLSIS